MGEDTDDGRRFGRSLEGGGGDSQEHRSGERWQYLGRGGSVGERSS